MGVQGWIVAAVLVATPAWGQGMEDSYLGEAATPSVRSRDDETKPYGNLASPQVEAGAQAAGAEALGITPRFESDTFPVVEEGGMLRSTLRTITAVGFVLALIFGLAFFVKRYVLKGAVVGSRGKFIRVVDTLFLGPRKNLMVVEAFGDRFLLAGVGSGLQFLSRINEPRREARPPVIEEEPVVAQKAAERRAAAGGVPLTTWKKTIQEEIQRLKRQA